MPEAIELTESIPDSAHAVNLELLQEVELNLLRAYAELFHLRTAPAARAYIKQAMQSIALVRRGVECSR